MNRRIFLKLSCLSFIPITPMQQGWTNAMYGKFGYNRASYQAWMDMHNKSIELKTLDMVSAYPL
jgi:hypothetical protein